MIKSFLAFLLQVGFVAALSGQYNTTYYTVKFPDDQTIYGCAADPGAVVYPYITGNPNCSFNVGVSYNDQIFYTNSTGGCYKILRTWKLLYWCDYNPNWPAPYMIMNPPNSDTGPTVMANNSNHGYLQYTQVIKVIDTQAPYYVDCPAQPVVFCDYTNNDPNQYNNGWMNACEGPVDLKVCVKDACSGTDIDVTYRLFLDLDGNGSMETYISSSSANAWPINTTVQGDTVCARIQFPSGHGFPYGKHKIEWIANDNCGNEALCKYEFIVKDCKSPSVVCYNGLSVNIMQTGMITIWDTDFIKQYFDNCTPNSQIKIGIRKAGTGTGFPADSHSVTFDCSELGKQYVEVWAQDAYGNASYCTTFIDVQDNSGGCPPSNKFTGTIATDNAVPVAGATVSLKKYANNLLDIVTDAEGKFEISPMTAGCNYLLVPTFDSPAKTGVNTLDALLVQAQIDNIQPLDSPYKLLAGDVDNSGALTAADALNIVQVAIGASPVFPNGQSWQFVPQGHVFSDPLNPWSASIPPSVAFCLSGDINFNPNFVGVKAGDVNGSAAISDFTAGSNDRSQDGGVAFLTNEQYFTSGQEIRVEVITPDLANLAAFQFTLDYDPATLSFVGMEPGIVNPDHFAQPAEHQLTAGWYNAIMLDPSIQVKNLQLHAFTLVFSSLHKGVLSEALHMNSAVADAEAYTRGLQTLPASLEFVENTTASKGAASFFSVRPNPVTDRFTTTYYLPEGGETTLRLTDATGRVLQTVQTTGVRGYNEAEFDVQGAESGLLFLRLDGPGGTDVQKVMKF